MNKVFIDGSQFIQSNVYGCEFRNCYKVIIVGSVDKCTFINCGIVGMGDRAIIPNLSTVQRLVSKNHAIIPISRIVSIFLFLE